MRRTYTRKILVVEDHPEISAMMVAMLHSLGHEATAAASVRETADLVAAATFDLLLVDYQLPDGDGGDVLKRLTPPTQAVLLTAHDEQMLPPSVRKGFACCLSKPVDMESLEKTIQSACGG